MRYIIWGAGKRGKWVLQFLGEERVLAFVDNNREKAGNTFCGKEIVSWREAIRRFSEFILVITPLEGSTEIEKELKEEKFFRYLKLDDCPMSIPFDEEEEYSFELTYEKKISYGLYGVNLFSLWLYDELKKDNISVKLAAQAGVAEDIIELLKTEYELVELADLKDADRVILMEDNPYDSIINHNCILADEFIIQSLNSCNDNILKYKNIHKGKRCFIVATGPSLTVEDLELLYEHDEICISMNRIFNIFDKTEWRPDYYVVGDKIMIEDMADDIARLDLPNKFVSTVPKVYWDNPNSKNSIPYRMLLRGFKEKQPLFSQYAQKGMYQGTTVTYICMQLAVYMGFSEIYLLGVDFNYSNNIYDPKNHFEGCDTSENKIRLNPVYPEITRLAYESCRDYCKKHNVQMYNATRGGKLEVFERKCFDSLFDGQ